VEIKQEKDDIETMLEDSDTEEDATTLPTILFKAFNENAYPCRYLTCEPDV